MSTISELEGQIRKSQERVGVQRVAVDPSTGEAKSKEKSRLQLLETELRNLQSSLVEVKSRSK